VPAATGRIRTPSAYRTALHTPGALAFFVAAAPARIGTAMTGLGIVWLVHGATASYGAAGTVTGAFAVGGAVVGPQVARLTDRFGQNRMLPVGLLAHAVAVALLIGLTRAPLWQTVAAGALVGATLPQVGALTAARWSALLRGSPVLSSAFALEALGNDIAFLVGPALVGTVSTAASPVIGSVVATGLVLAGGVALAVQRRTSPPPVAAGVSRSGQLLDRAFMALVGVNVGIGLFFGAMQVSVTAFAIDQGAAGLAGPLYSVTSLIGMLAGLAFGVRRWRMPASTQFVIALAALCLSCLPLLAARDMTGLAVALALPGLALAPCLILTSVLTEQRVGPAVLTQAFTWLGSGSAGGIAIAGTLTGRVVDGHGARWGFALAVLATAIACAVALAGRGRPTVSRPDDRPRPGRRRRRTRRGRRRSAPRRPPPTYRVIRRALDRWRSAFRRHRSGSR